MITTLKTRWPHYWLTTDKHSLPVLFSFLNQSTLHNRVWKCQTPTFPASLTTRGWLCFPILRGSQQKTRVEVKWERSLFLLCPAFEPGWGRICYVELWQTSYLQEVWAGDMPRWPCLPHWIVGREDRVQEALLRLGRAHEGIPWHTRGTKTSCWTAKNIQRKERYGCWDFILKTEMETRKVRLQNLLLMAVLIRIITMHKFLGKK